MSMLGYKDIKDYISYMPVPVCVMDGAGKIVAANKKIGEVFLYDGIEGSDVFALLGIRKEDLFAASMDIKDESNKLEVNLEDERESKKAKKQLKVERNDKIFKLEVKGDITADEVLLGIYFFDITEQARLEALREDSKSCLAIVNIDNFDELTSSTEDEDRLTIVSVIDKKIRAWANTMKGSITRHKESQYLVFFENKYLKEQKETKFPILDEIREVETDADFPVTLSIGIGVSGGNPEENDDYAAEALDLALGRGGDQAVIKNGDKLSYYGGKAQTVEKNNKGKSRIIGHALKRLIDVSSRVFIMGHKNPDMDSFGSSMGISRLVTSRNKDAYIIVDSYTEALESLYGEAKSSEAYNLIGNAKAMELVDEDSLVIILDTHRPGQTECQEILKTKARRVVIDHHRKAEDFIDGPTLVHLEPYASSAAEIVTEILQYTIDRKEVTRLEAEALLAGIFVDTNRFSVKSGVRTFEAAAWLRRAGADIANVKRLFQVQQETFRIRAKCVAAAEISQCGIAYSICEGKNLNSQIINSQVADELLTIKGIFMSFVAGQDNTGKTVISARSIGSKNVQIIMEEFNGGGHLNSAGAQVDMEPIEAIEKIKDMLRKQEIERKQED
ncbi:MAG: DHH family phosphoesterase [Anaerovoracaceae bacterium]